MRLVPQPRDPLRGHPNPLRTTAIRYPPAHRHYLIGSAGDHEMVHGIGSGLHHPLKASASGELEPGDLVKRQHRTEAHAGFAVDTALRTLIEPAPDFADFPADGAASLKRHAADFCRDNTKTKDRATMSGCLPPAKC